MPDRRGLVSGHNFQSAVPLVSLLLNQNGGRSWGLADRIPFVLTDHPFSNVIYDFVSRIYPMLDVSEEHKVLPNKQQGSFL